MHVAVPQPAHARRGRSPHGRALDGPPRQCHDHRRGGWLRCHQRRQARGRGGPPRRRRAHPLRLPVARRVRRRLRVHPRPHRGGGREGGCAARHPLRAPVREPHRDLLPGHRLERLR
ncbi:hypothetical protein ACFPRL_05470 [Pseudoclavibacter helvolus]